MKIYCTHWRIQYQMIISWIYIRWFSWISTTVQCNSVFGDYFTVSEGTLQGRSSILSPQISNTFTNYDLLQQLYAFEENAFKGTFLNLFVHADWLINGQIMQISGDSNLMIAAGNKLEGTDLRCKRWANSLDTLDIVVDNNNKMHVDKGIK